MTMVELYWVDDPESSDHEYWYRYNDVSYSYVIDAEAERYGSELKVELQKFRVLKITPKGAWVKGGRYARRFVLRGARKRLCCPTIEEAKESFIARKRKQAAIYDHRAERARKSIRIINGEKW